jgi:flagellar protein FlgJ
VAVGDISASLNGSSPLKDATNSLAIDSKGLSSLKSAAHENSPEAIRGVAKQFEAIFLNMMLKSMRDATPSDGPLDSEQSRTFTTMLDQQLTQTIANKGVGLAEVLVRQLSKIQPGKTDLEVKTAENNSGVSESDGSIVSSHSGFRGNSTNSTNSSNSNNIINPHMNTSMSSRSLSKLSHYNLNGYTSVDTGGAYSSEPGHTMQQMMLEFRKRMEPYAEKISAKTGIPAIFMMAQAALESGWGRSEIKYQNGANSHNLFGIKATGNWEGRSVDAPTSEYVDGEKVMRVEKFRAYNSYAESFKDFTDLIRSNPRYAKVLRNLNDPVSYAQAMGKSGYATDPLYGKKLQSVILNFMSVMK